MLAQLPRYDEPGGSLDFPRGNRPSVAFLAQFSRLGSQSLENVSHERIHDDHRPF